MNDEAFEKRVKAFQKRCKRVYRELGVKGKKGRKRDVWRPIGRKKVMKVKDAAG